MRTNLTCLKCFRHLKGVILFFFFFLVTQRRELFAQGGRLITGVVKNKQDSTALPGVSILVKGHERIATRTDNEGKFQLTVPDDTRALIFSSAGYEGREIPLNGSGPVAVWLVAAIQSLNDVVVVGYGTQKKSDITGSVTSVSKDRLSKIPVTNVLQALEGSVAG
ncbi:MAG: carboxypeptidase-like regulatory domain-containing protein, partial [Bacteroidota bacterium]